METILNMRCYVDMLLITSTANIKLEKEITGYMVVYPRWCGELA